MIYSYINPIAAQWGPFKIYWYGLLYVVGFLLAWLLGRYRASLPKSGWSQEQVADLVFYAAVGVVVGGRLGYMLFYNLPYFIGNPISMFRVWEGGMSFHGGALGVVIALWLLARKYHKTFFQVADFTVPLAPLGLAAGRLGNFINEELWGRVTAVPWGIVYPHVGPERRHPSQIYEFLLEGILLFTILWIYSRKPRPCMAVTGMFLSCYGIFRCFAEVFRQPDIQYGFIAFDWLTMGQLLSFPMIVVGIALLWRAYKSTQ